MFATSVVSFRVARLDFGSRASSPTVWRVGSASWHPPPPNMVVNGKHFTCLLVVASWLKSHHSTAKIWGIFCPPIPRSTKPTSDLWARFCGTSCGTSTLGALMPGASSRRWGRKGPTSRRGREGFRARRKPPGPERWGASSVFAWTRRPVFFFHPFFFPALRGESKKQKNKTSTSWTWDAKCLTQIIGVPSSFPEASPAWRAVFSKKKQKCGSPPPFPGLQKPNMYCKYLVVPSLWCLTVCRWFSGGASMKTQQK